MTVLTRNDALQLIADQGKDIVIPGGITAIGQEAFRDLTDQDNEITSVAIPESVKIIGSGAFRNGALLRANIPDGVTNISNSAFHNNRLTNITLPDGLTSIGYFAFYHNQLTSINLPDGVTSIGGNSFSDNQLTSVVIPSSVKTIGPAAFHNNILTSVVIPEGVKTIEPIAFNLNQLSSVVIPDSVTSIGARAFERNPLKTISVPCGLKFDDSVFPEDADITVRYSKPSYQLSISLAEIDEGNAFSAIVDTTCVSTGTNLYYSIEGNGINKNDFSTPLLGNIVIGSNGLGDQINDVIRDNLSEVE